MYLALCQMEGVTLFHFIVHFSENLRWKAVYRSIHQNRSMDQLIFWPWQWPVEVLQKGM